MKLYNKIQVTLLSVILVLLAASCSDESDLQGGGTTPPVVVPEGQAALKLKFNDLTKRSYSDYLKGSEAENRIDSVKLFFFDQDRGDTLVSVYTVVAPDYGLEGDNLDGREATLVITEKSNRMNIVAIANPADSVVLHNWIPYIGVINFEKFKMMTTLPSDSMPKPSLVMTALQNGGPLSIGITSAVPTATFDLTRAVARVDVLNRDSIGFLHVFELQRARLVGITSQAHLYEIGTPVDGSKKLNTLPFIELDPSDGSVGTMFNQLYTYPTGDGVGESGVALEIEGLYNGVHSEYRIPFGDRAIKANHRYVVAIDSVSPTTVQATITVADWDTDTIKFSPENGAAPTVILPATLPAGVTLKTASVAGAPDTLEGTYTSKEIEFEVRSVTVEPIFSTTANWITVLEEELISYAGFAKRIKLKMDSTIYGQEALIHFVNPINMTERVSFFVKHLPTTISETANPLSKFATANLASIGTFGEELTAETAGMEKNYGSVYQWGRKVAFANNAETLKNISASRLNFLSGAASTDFITATPWHSESSAANGDIWTRLYGLTDIDNDPCPAGYKVPTHAEWLAVTPNNNSYGTYATTSVRTVAETDLGNVFYAGAGIDSDNVRTLYGVKLNNTENAYALRWRYVGDAVLGKTYLEVTSIKVGLGFVAATTMTNTRFANLPWDTDEAAAQRVVRYFPIAGHRDLSAVSTNRGSIGYYWASTTTSTTNAQYLHIANNSVYPTTASNRSVGYSVRCISN